MKSKIEFVKHFYETIDSVERALNVYQYCDSEKKLEELKLMIEKDLAPTLSVEFVRCGNELIDGLYCDWFSINYIHGEMTEIKNNIKCVYKNARKVLN